jgi:hypothetical protein
MNDERLGIHQYRAAGSGISDVSDRAFAFQLFQMAHFENIVNKPHTLIGGNPFVGGCCDTAALLTPMLKCIKAEIADFRSFSMAVNPKKPARLPGFLIIGEELKRRT